MEAASCSHQAPGGDYLTEAALISNPKGLTPQQVGPTPPSLVRGVTPGTCKQTDLQSQNQRKIPALSNNPC